MRVYLFLLLIISTFCTVEAQRIQRESGVVLKLGLTGTSFNPGHSKLLSSMRTGYTFGFDGLFYDGWLLIQPGLHANLYNDGNDRFFGSLEKPFDKIVHTKNWTLHLPLRIGLNVLDTRAVRFKVTGGFFADYSPEGLDLQADGYSQPLRYFNIGWTANAGLIILPFSIEADYGRTFNKFSPDSNFSKEAFALSLGIIF